eukprot:2652203-Pleurochrysis_carterae.AAC.1
MLQLLSLPAVLPAAAAANDDDDEAIMASKMDASKGTTSYLSSSCFSASSAEILDNFASYLR